MYNSCTTLLLIPTEALKIFQKEYCLQCLSPSGSPCPDRTEYFYLDLVSEFVFNAHQQLRSFGDGATALEV